MTKNILLGLLIIAVFGVGLYIGQTNYQATTIRNKQTVPMLPSNQTSTTTENTVGATPTWATSFAEHMTDDQKQMMRAFGIDVEKLTPTMIVCAETSLGTSRIEEIKKGSPPSLTEKAKLLACYK